MVPPQWSCDLEVLDAPRQRGQQGFGFQAGDVLADALVDAHAEADVSRGITEEIEGVRVVPGVRVAVGGAEEHQYLLALGDDGSADFHIGRRGAEERLHRGLPADGLVEGNASQAGLLPQSLPLVGVSGEGV